MILLENDTPLSEAFSIPVVIVFGIIAGLVIRRLMHGPRNPQPKQRDGWFRWFAWRPVDTQDRGWRWLRIVWRHRTRRRLGPEGGSYLHFEHSVIHPKDLP